MFVNPVSSFSMANAYRNNNLNNNVKYNQNSPVMQQSLNADTVSFGENKEKKNKGMVMLPAAVVSALIAGSAASCAPDYESYSSLSQETVLNLADYHKCHCDSFPFIIPPGGGNNGGKDTIIVHDTIPGDTVWIHDLDTVYIPKNLHFEINDSINKDIKDFDIPSEGNGDFIYAFQGRNEYLGANHLFLFNGFFSDERTSSFVDHAFEEDDIPEGGNKPTKYYYTRYDISSDYENGRRCVDVYKPAKSVHQLPDDQKSGRAGWVYKGRFYVNKESIQDVLKMIVRGTDDQIVTGFFNNDKRGPGNIYKGWPLEDSQKPETTIENVKVYKTDINKLK